MLPDRVPNPGPLTYESGALPIALRGPALTVDVKQQYNNKHELFITHTSNPLEAKYHNFLTIFLH